MVGRNWEAESAWRGHEVQRLQMVVHRQRKHIRAQRAALRETIAELGQMGKALNAQRHENMTTITQAQSLIRHHDKLAGEIKALKSQILELEALRRNQV